MAHLRSSLVSPRKANSGSLRIWRRTSATTWVGRALELGRRLDQIGLFLGFRRLLEGDEPGGGHGVDDVVASVVGPFLLPSRVVEGWVADGDRDGGRLGDSEILQILSEVLEGRRPHPVGGPPEIDRVEVELEYLPLGVPLLQLDGEERLLDLAPDGQLVAHDVVLDHLLGDSGAAPAGGAGHVVAHGADDGREVDPFVLEIVPRPRRPAPRRSGRRVHPICGPAPSSARHAARPTAPRPRCRRGISWTGRAAPAGRPRLRSPASTAR